MRKRIKIGQLLVGAGVLSEEQLDVALVEQKKLRLKLGRTLIELGFLSEERLSATLSEQLHIPIVDLSERDLDEEVVRQLPETLARRLRVVLLEANPERCVIGMVDPTDLMGADEVARVLRRPVDRAIVREADLLRVVDMAYRRTEEIHSLAAELRAELGESDPVADVGMPSDAAESAPVVKLLASLFEDAMRVQASDIHIEPGEDALRIRQRVDGVLQEHVMDQKQIVPALVQRLKLMAGLDISERRLPQDGRFLAKVGSRQVDVRLSTMPIQYGESVVMRLLDQSGGMIDLEKLGLPERVLERIRALLQNPHGMFLVTGPTGSGKTTTLYASLSEINRPECKIITVEDPVEYRLERINQVQVNAKIELSFARVLRAALRQDPDVVMLGEIRDEETAQIALRAAMTGHLVLSTVHTNDSVSTALRLIDMGAPGYLVASSVRAILAQRLIRKVCARCAEPYTPTERERASFVSLMGEAAAEIECVRGAGCNRCGNSGYRGRAGVYELLELDTALADLLRRGDSAGFVRAAQAHPQLFSLRSALADLLRSGTTTLDEAFRVLGSAEFDNAAAPA